MSREEARKLLGGYAAGVLTPEERQALFEAALESQDLFDELAREQSLADLLRDPASKAYLLAALGETRAAWHERLTGWIWGHAMGVAAVACFLSVGGYVAWQARISSPRERVRVVAMEPTTIEVNGADKPTQPRRVFDLSSMKPPAPNAPDLPPPPALRSRAPAVAAEPRISALNRPLAFSAPQREFPQVAPLAMGAPGARANFVVDGIADLDTGANGPAASGGGAGARGGAVGNSGPGAAAGVAGGLVVPRPTEEVTVTAAATPVQSASSENSKLTDANQMSNVTLKGRDPGGMLQTVPGVGGTSLVDANGDAGGERQLAPADAKLDPALRAVVARVRTEASPSADESKFVIRGEAYVRMTLTNASRDTLAQLKTLGFTVTRQERNELTGHVAVAKLEAIAQLPFVVWIAPR